MLASLPALAQPRDDQGEIRRLRLGLNAKTMSADGYGEFACGSNGGPPRPAPHRLVGVRQVPAEDNGDEASACRCRLSDDEGATYRRQVEATI